MIVTTYQHFCEQYDKWLADCLIEFNERFGESRLLLPDDLDYDDPGLFVEFTEEGSAYPHSLCGTNWIRGAVTPWRDSPHFTQ